MFRRSVLLFLALLALLIGSNLWWWFRYLDLGVTLKYTDQLLYERTHEAAALKITCLELSSESTKTDVLAALKRVNAESDPFEKDGLLNATWLSFRFGDDGRLVDVLTGDEVSEYLSNGGS